MSKRLISVLVALIMFIGLMPAVGATGADISSQFSDMPNNWATEALEFAVANHLLQGADGKIMPDKPLTRAEMATIIVRAFGASEEGDISSYTDVRKSDWFFEYIAKAFKMGVMEGYSGKMNPDSNITREQAFTVLARALKLQPATRISKTFSDIEEISDWARGSIYALVNAGYIQGSNGKLNPKADITRAEFAQVMFNLIKQYISEEGEYTEVAEGNVMINVPGATLKGLTVSGDLIIGDGVGDGDVVLDDVVVTGRLVIRGGGENSIIIRGNSNVSYIVAARVDGTVRILVEDDAEVEVIYVDDGSDDIIVEGNVGQIEIVADNVTVLATGASIGSANITGVNSRIIVDADSEVESISVRAANASIDVEGSVNEISTSGANTNVTGGGKVDKVNVEQGGNGASITTPNTEISVGENVTGVTAGGGEEVEGGQTVKNNKDGTGIVSEPPASGGTYVPPVIPVSAISIDQEDQLLEKGSTLQLTTTVSPANATNKTVAWSSSDETVATVDNSGMVTAVGKGTATITATTVDGNKTDTITITVPIVAQDASSLKKAIQEDADDGDTIVLRAGRYELDETLVITKSVKILGPQANVDPRPSKNSPRKDDNNEAVLTGDKGDKSNPASQQQAKDAGWLASIFEIKSHDVVINGLTMERTYNHIIFTSKNNNNENLKGLEIVNNIVRYGRGNEGIKVGSTINTLIQHNYIHDILNPGDAIEAINMQGFRILDNEIVGCDSVNGSINLQNMAGGETGIVRGNLIKDTSYHFAIQISSSTGDIIVDNNSIENAKAGGIFIYKNKSISEDKPTLIEITNNTINNYATDPVKGTDYRETYLREAASAIAVSYNLKEGIQPVVTIAGNTTSNGADGKPVLAFGGGTTDASAIPTDLSRITVSGNVFDNPYIKYIKTSGELDISDNTWVGVRVYNETTKEEYDTIQGAINEADLGKNIIKVFPGDYGTDPIEIIQREGVNITLEAVGEVVLKNQIKIDGGGRYEAEDTLTIRGFTFDFSDTEGDIITTANIKSQDRVYAHNVTFEDCTFIGNKDNNKTVVAVRAAAKGGHTNFAFKNCRGLDLHSMGQLTSVTGVTVEDCTVENASEGGFNLPNCDDITIKNSTVYGTLYGVRTGPGGEAPNKEGQMTVSDSYLEAEYPIWLRKGSPEKVEISDTELEVVGDDGQQVKNEAGSTVTIDGAILVSNSDELLAALDNDEIKTILLADGKYGKLLIRNIGRPVSIVALNQHEAKFESIEIKSSNIVIDGVETGYIDFYGVSDITITNNLVTDNRFTVAIGGAGGSNNGPATITNNIVKNGAIGLMPTEDFKNYTISNNTIEKAPAEGIWLWYQGSHAGIVDAEKANSIADMLLVYNQFSNYFDGKNKVKVQFGVNSDKIFR